MKILMIAPEPVMAPRGTPISVVQRLRALSSLGHEVDLLTYPLGDPIEIPNVTIHRSLRVPGISDIKPGPSWRKAVLDVLLFAKAMGMLARNRYDAIHSHEEAAFFAGAVAPIFRTKHIYDMHSSLPRQLLAYSYGRFRPLVRIFAMLEKWTLGRVDAVIAIDPDLAAYVRQTNPSAPLTTIENLPIQASTNGGVRASDVAEIKAGLSINGKLAIVYTGNFASYQGLELLVDAAELVRREAPNVVFVLVGGIPKRVDYWKQIIRSRGLEDDFKFAGIVDVQEIPNYLELAAILVSPRTDGMSVPLKIYTYMLSGKPIVATNLRAHSQVLNEDISLLVPPTSDGLSAGILALVREAKLRRQLGKRALDHANWKYGFSQYLLKVNSAYESIDRPKNEVPETSYSTRN